MPADEPDLALEIARAERLRDADERARRNRAAAWPVWTACGVTLVGLVLPWSHSRDYTRDAFGGSSWPVTFGLLTVFGVVGTLAFSLAGPDTARPRLVRAVAWVGALVSSVAAGVTALGEKDGDGLGHGHADALGPWIFVLGLVATAVLTHRVGRDEDAPPEHLVDAGHRGLSVAELRVHVASRLRRDRPGVTGLVASALAMSGLVLTLVGLVAPWQRMHSPALRTLVDGADEHSFLGDESVWGGLELSGTVVLRWALLATAVLVVATVPFARLRRTVTPTVLVVGGVVIVVRGWSGLAFDTLRGVNATVTRDVGPLLVVLGGVLCVAAGGVVLASWIRPRTAVAVTAAAVAVLGVLAAPTPYARANATTATPVLDGESPGGPVRLGGSALDVPVNTSQRALSGVDTVVRPDVVSTEEGLFFTTPAAGEEHPAERVLMQVVHGRALPVTVLFGQDNMTLLDVVHGRAIVQVFNDSSGGGSAVYSVDLHTAAHSVSVFGRIGDGSPGDTAMVLSTLDPLESGYPDDAEQQRRGGRLTALGPLTVTRASDGGMLLGDKAAHRSWYVDAATVRSGRVWRPTVVPYADVEGTGGVGYRLDAGAVTAIERTGASHAVVGGVSDPRCTPSRDPRRSRLSLLPPPEGGTYALSVDTAGDVFFLLPTSDSQSAYVRTADGLLRRLPGSYGTDLRALQVMPDGSLLLQRKQRSFSTPPILRVASAAAFARTGTPLRPVAHGCVSDNTVPLESQRRTVHQVYLPAVDEDDSRFERPAVAVIDTAGTRVFTTGDSPGSVVQRVAARGKATTVRKPGASWYATGVVADGRGGAWWAELDTAEGSRTARLVHLEANGHVHVARTIRTAKNDSVDDAPELAADLADGSLWWRAGVSGRWTRTTTDGASRGLRFDGANPSVRDGRGYALTDDGSRVDAVSADAGPALVLGGGKDVLSLPSALATRLAPRGVSTQNSLVAVDQHDRLLFLGGGQLARVTRGGDIGVVAGAAQGLPVDIATLAYSTATVFGNTLVVFDGSATIWTVDVS